MIYAYVIVIYVTQVTFKYITIVYMTIGCQKTCGERVLYIKIFSATLYIIKFDECKLFMNMCIYHVTAKSNTLPLDNREAHSIVLLSFALFSYISL